MSIDLVYSSLDSRANKLGSGQEKKNSDDSPVMDKDIDSLKQQQNTGWAKYLLPRFANTFPC